MCGLRCAGSGHEARPDSQGSRDGAPPWDDGARPSSVPCPSWPLGGSASLAESSHTLLRVHRGEGWCPWPLLWWCCGHGGMAELERQQREGSRSNACVGEPLARGGREKQGRRRLMQAVIRKLAFVCEFALWVCEFVSVQCMPIFLTKTEAQEAGSKARDDDGVWRLRTGPKRPIQNLHKGTFPQAVRPHKDVEKGTK